MDEKDEPRPDDTLEAAQAKSLSVDERAARRDAPPRTTEAMVAGAPATHLPQMGAGLPADGRDLEPGEGEEVLANESKAVRADIQRG